MRVIHFLCFGICAALLAGCQQQPTVAGAPPSAQVCNASCDVVVSVKETPTGPQPCDISVNPDIKVDGNDRTIRWQMDDASAKADFRFDQRDGVLLKPDASDPTHQFYEQGPHGGGKQFHWIDKNSYKAMFEYEINVYKGNPHSGIKCKKDPRIWNS